LPWDHALGLPEGSLALELAAVDGSMLTESARDRAANLGTGFGLDSARLGAGVFAGADLAVPGL